MQTLIADPDFREFLEAMEYFALRDTRHGPVGLTTMVYTVGIAVDLGLMSYRHRYCYATLLEATGALQDWEAKGYAGEPAGYIVRKGRGGDKRRPQPGVIINED